MPPKPTIENVLQVITGYLLAGSIIGPGGFSFVNEMVQVRCFHLLSVAFLDAYSLCLTCSVIHYLIG
jgi:hypothetical protein